MITLTLLAMADGRDWRDMPVWAIDLLDQSWNPDSVLVKRVGNWRGAFVGFNDHRDGLYDNLIVAQIKVDGRYGTTIQVPLPRDIADLMYRRRRTVS